MEIEKFTLSIIKKILLKVRKKSGFALIFVLVFVAAIMGVVGDIIYESQLAAKEIFHTEDEVNAQFTAKTGMEFALFLLNFYYLTKSVKDNPAVPIPDHLYSILNGIPVGTESIGDIQKITGMDVSKLLAPELLAALKSMKGYFVLDIGSENQKLNINMLQSTYGQVMRKALLHLFSTPDSQKLLDLYQLTPEQLVDSMEAYIKSSPTPTNLDTQVQNMYDNLGLNYKAKHAPLESMEELRRIPGFHIDNIYNVFAPYFTVWPLDGPNDSTNINGTPLELIVGLMEPLGQNPYEDNEPWDKFEIHRLKKKISPNTIGEYFKKNFPKYQSDKDLEDIRNNIFGSDDNVFKVKCRGVVNGVERKITYIVENRAGNLASQLPTVQTDGAKPRQPPLPNVPGQPPGTPPTQSSQQQPGQAPGSDPQRNKTPSNSSTSQKADLKVVYTQYE